ncbi:putative phenazine biosynthesis-like protein [Aspergillus nomiae NRRL 13137]|uniref:Putative phenazine biosynthesis-like protein n=1 Tax=Aspergillus nomiae NRRL (strain ATCC 15546 / NRRL 13137 / CBS 260.88 / M93) TaxID=1509407 RepID=A0A0L1J6G7_ASPN3|nr:putative phenazine biosynthesis-like protein [Aspergillus nomiae NRRL 13137]KNG87280.1 putative phenazine biosynthesis-like protein [Aspergillus nomiae NRRL 13137]
MPQSLRFVTLDVFTTEPFLGNPLGVVFLPNSPEHGITQEQKQLIAREFNYPETIFVHPHAPSDTTRKIDIFTTAEELPFAGHPTIGAVTWFLELSPDSADRTNVDTLITKAGPFAMARVPNAGGAVAARIAHNVHIHSRRFPLAELLRLHPSLGEYLGGGRDGANEEGFPVFSIVKGMTQVHVQLPSLEALAAAEGPVSGEVVPCTSVSEGGYLDAGWEGDGLIVVYFFVPGVYDEKTGKTVIRSRMFLRNFEDPATGSAASGLAAYLTLTRARESSDIAFDYDIVQGVEMGRRSDIGVAVTVDREDRAKVESVELRGTAVQVKSGEIRV